MQAGLATEVHERSRHPEPDEELPHAVSRPGAEHVEPDAGEGEREQRVVKIADVEAQRRAVRDQPEHEQAQAADHRLPRERGHVVVPRLVGGEGRAHVEMLARPGRRRTRVDPRNDPGSARMCWAPDRRSVEA